MPKHRLHITLLFLSGSGTNSTLFRLIQFSEKFQNSGQGLAIVYEDIPNYQSDEHYASAAIDSWFDEAAQNGEKYGWMKIINSFSQTDPWVSSVYFRKRYWDSLAKSQLKFYSIFQKQRNRTFCTNGHGRSIRCWLCANKIHIKIGWTR